MKKRVGSRYVLDPEQSGGVRKMAIYGTRPRVVPQEIEKPGSTPLAVSIG